MRPVLLMTALLLVTACSRQQNPAPTPESQSDNAAASAPNGVGSQRDNVSQSQANGPARNDTPPPSATAVDQARNTDQSATSRSSADQQGVTASPPD